METPTLLDAPKRKSSIAVLLWIALIGFCLFVFIASMGLMGWGFYSLVQQENEKSNIPYATATAVAQWPVVFRDDFKKVANHWYTGDYTEEGRRETHSISNGVFTWKLENGDGYTYWDTPDAGNFKDFSVTVDVRHTTGTMYDEYGLIFNCSGEDYYVFAIQDSGSYTVEVWNADTWNLIIPPSRSNAIKPGEFNHLMVLAESGAFKLFINDEFVEEFRDSTLPGGDVGLMLNPQEGPIPPASEPNVAYTFTNSTSKAIFDNFEVRAPKGSTPDPSTPTQLAKIEPTKLPPLGTIQLPKIEPENGKLVFASYETKNLIRHIFTILTDGSGLKQLTDGPGDDYAPRWSPDGKKIAFVSKRNGNPEIYVMDADGKNPTRLTHNPAEDISPDWSPDGKQILFSSNRDGNYNMYLMPVEGEEVGFSQLTDTTFNELNPSISPDGKYILFQENENNKYSLYIMGIDGKHKNPLTDYDDVITYSDGAWAPDSYHFAYDIHYQNVRGDILVGSVNQGLSSQSGDHITRNQGMNLYPNWSPSGEQLVFVSDMDGQSDIYIILADGSGIFQVTHTEADDESPDWFAP